MFQLSKMEFENLKSQFVISSWGGVRKMPYAFTDYGVAMLSGILNSPRAIEINIQIMRAFTRLRNLVADNADLRKAIQQIERRLNTHDQQIQVAFAALKGLLQAKTPAPKKYRSKNIRRMRERKWGLGRGRKKRGLGEGKGLKQGNNI